MLLPILLWIGVISIIISFPAVAIIIDNEDLFALQKDINNELSELNLIGRLIPIVAVSILTLPATIVGIGWFAAMGALSRFVKLYCLVFKKRK